MGIFGALPASLGEEPPKTWPDALKIAVAHKKAEYINGCIYGLCMELAGMVKQGIVDWGSFKKVDEDDDATHDKCMIQAHNNWAAIGGDAILGTACPQILGL